MKNTKKNSRRGAEKQRSQRVNISGVATPDPAVGAPQNLRVSASLREKNTPAPITPEVLPGMYAPAEPDSTDAAERIRFQSP